MSDLQSLQRFDSPVCTPRTREVSKTRRRPPAPSWQARLGRGRARDDEGAFGPQSVGRKGHQEFESRRVRSMARGKSPTYGTARAPAALWTMQHRSWRDSGRRATPDRVDALAARSFPTASSRRVSEHLMQRLELLIQFISDSPEVERPVLVELALKQMETRPREMEVRHHSCRAFNADAATFRPGRNHRYRRGDNQQPCRYYETPGG